MITCHCEHEKAEHYEGDGNCMRQCDCKRFRDSRIPEATPTDPYRYPWGKSHRPHVNASCKCTGCQRYDIFGY